MKRLIERARDEALLEGRVEGRIDVLLRLMALRFGGVDAPATQRVRSASVADLERWTERILTATSLGDLFGTD